MSPDITTPKAQQNADLPLSNITNNAAPSSSASTSTTTYTRLLPTRASLRQTTLFSAFAPPPDVHTPSSSLQSALFDDALNFASSSSSGVSSPLATSPCSIKTRDDEHDYLSARGQQWSEDGAEDLDVPMTDDFESEGVASGVKRRRITRDQVDDKRLVGTFEVDQGKRKISSLSNVPGRQMSVFAMNSKRALGLRAGGAQVSMRPYLQSIVSDNNHQVYRCPSETRDFAPPFTLAFSKAAKKGGKQVFAVADEEGVVHFMNGSEDSQYDFAHGHTQIRAHQNAIFDVAWSHDDQLLATASGDQTVKLFDVQTQQCVGVLAGHTCTIKSVVWDPFNPNLLSTASRDGSIRVWDRRVEGVELPPPSGPVCATAPAGSSVATVNHIKNAHGTKGKVSKGRSATKSVTGLAYLPHSENLLASSGSSDSLIKVWDLRRAHSRRVNPAFVETNEEAVSSMSTGSARPHGISNMTISPNGQRLYGLSTDGHVYGWDSGNLTYPAPLAVFRHPSTVCGSFYPRVSVSPDSRYVACGSTDAGIYVWDAQGTGKDGVRLLGHEKETSGLDWGHETLASCSDDYLVRVWNFKPEVARQRREDKEVLWRWSGETEV